MIHRGHRSGFTLLEMMIALVIGAMVMASLVGISASIQRTFGRSGEITELQANLRFAMKTITQDLSRTAFMFSPDLSEDRCHLLGSPISTDGPPSMEYESDDASYVRMTLRGNFASSRDYLMDMTSQKIVCRNKRDFLLAGKCSSDYNITTDNKYERYLQPFGDGPGIEGVFRDNSWVRIEADSRRYAYYQINNVNPGDYSISFKNTLDRNAIPGDFRWISPVTSLRWALEKDETWVPPFGSASGANARWVLYRQHFSVVDETESVDRQVEVVDFLLPPGENGGLEFSVVNDSMATLCARRNDSNLQPAVAMSASVDPIKARAVRVKLRGRTETEDPQFLTGGATPDPNLAVDLDGEVDNGLAHVVTESTVVNMRNLSLDYVY